MPRAPKAPGHAGPREPFRGSVRRSELTAEFYRLRPLVLERDGFRCRRVVLGERCMAWATDVDHVVPGGPDRMDDLESLCVRHHRQKTGAEGARSARGRRW